MRTSGGLARVLLLLLVLSAGTAAAQIDMTGAWRVKYAPDFMGSGPEIWDFSQAGTVLDVTSSLITATGTIDTLSGAFLFDLGPGDPPFCTMDHSYVVGTASADGTFLGRLVIAANSPMMCGGFTINLLGALCLNSPLDPGEECITPFHTIPATKLVLRDSTVNTERRRILFIARGTDYAPAAQDSIGDPRGGATLIIARGSDEVVSINLRDSLWTPLSNGMGYRYRDPNGNNGPCRSAIWKNGLLKVVCRGSAIAYTLNEASQGTVSVTFQPGQGVRACAEFGGVVHDTPAMGSHTGVFRALDPTAPAACTPEALP